MPPATKAKDQGRDWEEISPFTEPRDLAENETIEGVYLGANEVVVPDPNSEDDGTRISLLHEFADTADSEPYGIWGSAVLDKRLADVPAGSFVRIQYEGKQTLKDGARTARRYRVWVDKGAAF